jgi:hypothetical protein
LSSRGIHLVRHFPFLGAFLATALHRQWNWVYSAETPLSAVLVSPFHALVFLASTLNFRTCPASSPSLLVIEPSFPGTADDEGMDELNQEVTDMIVERASHFKVGVAFHVEPYKVHTRSFPVSAHPHTPILPLTYTHCTRARDVRVRRWPETSSSYRSDMGAALGCTVMQPAGTDSGSTFTTHILSRRRAGRMHCPRPDDSLCEGQTTMPL